MLDIPEDLPEVFTREQGRAAGLSNRQMDRRLASGQLIAVQRGILRRVPADGKSLGAVSAVPPGPSAARRVFLFPEQDQPGDRLPLETRAALLTSPDRALVVSHAGAARLWQLPEPVGGWPAPEFTASTGTPRHRGGLNVRVARLPETEVVTQEDVSVTSPARTVIDCLRTLRGRDGLAIADAALHRQLATSEELLVSLAEQAGWPGIKAARMVLALADARRESPLESWSAWAFAHTGVAMPEWQVDIRGPDGRRLGRVDCWWRLAALAGEADGRAKYALASAARGGSADDLLDVLQAERRREQRLREVGAGIIRWSSHDVLDETAARALANRIRAALALGRQESRFDGVAVPSILPSYIP